MDTILLNLYGRYKMKKLGFGFMRLPVTDKEDVTTIDYNQLNAMVDKFIAGGFTYFDTAFFYHKGVSEEAIRKSLVARYPRESFILADKMPVFIIKEEGEYQTYFDGQLEKCGVDYFDYYLLHNLGARTYPSTCELGGFEYVQKLKAEGKVKRIGFSFHDKADLLDRILTEHPEMEFVQLQINYVDWDDNTIQSRQCYEVARKHGKDIIVMEPVKGGSLANLSEEAESVFKALDPNVSNVSWALRYAQSLDGVIAILSGMSEMAHVDDNMKICDTFTPLTDKEMEAVKAVEKIIKDSTYVSCTDCRYCVDDCPKNIAIPQYFGMFNQAKRYGNTLIQSVYYGNLASHEDIGAADECIECGKCEDHCPQHLPIIKHLKELDELFKSVSL
jgi:predicted aldo/keto reductase-like oxidoreductase